MLATSQRIRTGPDLLASQNGLYSVLTRPGEGEPSVRVVGVVRAVACAADEPQRIADAIPASTVDVVTLTAAEKGYRLYEGGPLALDDAVRSDLAGNPPQTVVGQTVRGLQAWAAATGPAPDRDVLRQPHQRRSDAPATSSDFVGRLPAPEVDVIDSWIESHVTQSDRPRLAPPNRVEGPLSDRP